MDNNENNSLLLKKNYLSNVNYEISDVVLNYSNILKEMIFHYNENIIKNDVQVFTFFKERNEYYKTYIQYFITIYK